MPRAVTTTVSAIDVQIANPLLDLFSQNSMDELLNRAIDPSSPDHPKLRAEIRKTDPQAILKGVEAFPKVNPFRDLLRVPMPVAVVLGEANRFLPWPSESLLHQLDERQQLKLVIFNECQHYPMLDQKAQFVRIIKDFLEAEDVGTLEIKEEWRRRKR
jgi:pimeloyl-ACP methyl ester carboxylesterase